MNTETISEKKTETMTKTKKTDIREKAIKCSKNEQVAGDEFAKVISIIYEKELWKEWGYNSFEEYGEKEPDINRKYKTMRNYAIAGDTIRRTGVSVKDVAKVDKSTFNHISSYAEAEKLTKEEIIDIITEVGDVPYEKAREIIRAKRVKDEVVREIVKLDLKLTKEMWDAIEPVITEGKSTFNTDNMGLVVANIILIYSANRNPELEQKMIKFLKGKGLSEPVKSKKVKRKKPSHAGKFKNKKE